MKEAAGYTAICIFVNKKINAEQVEMLKANGTKLILCCSAGFDNVPVEKCKEVGIRVGRVPSYSPSSIAEYAVSSIMALAKNIQKSYELTKKADFTIGGLQCMLLEDKVAGIIGTGLIGNHSIENTPSRILMTDIFRQKMRSKNLWLSFQSIVLRCFSRSGLDQNYSKCPICQPRSTFI